VAAGGSVGGGGSGGGGCVGGWFLWVWLLWAGGRHHPFFISFPPLHPTTPFTAAFAYLTSCTSFSWLKLFTGNSTLTYLLPHNGPDTLRVNPAKFGQELKQDMDIHNSHVGGLGADASLLRDRSDRGLTFCLGLDS